MGGELPRVSGLEKRCLGDHRTCILTRIGGFVQHVDAPETLRVPEWSNE